jgi:hypothetical protein
VKISNCHCEIIELRDAFDQVVGRNIRLKDRRQQAQETDGRFNLGQNAKTDIPLFEYDPTEFALHVISAAEKIRLEFGTYTARVRGYGDSGEPDEITVRADCRTAAFELLAT